VLIPRPETELLVDLTLALVASKGETVPGAMPIPPAIVDVGTGSGAIALALAHHLPAAWTIYATDISADALAVAHANAVYHQLDSRMRLLQGDLLAPLPTAVDIIVSNPPYTLLDEIDEGVRRYEPHLALDGGNDGVHVYHRLLADAPRWLRPGGAILLEIGATQAGAVAAIAQAHFPTAPITTHQDLAGHDRVVVVSFR
jgi:release factor glutamine methyltransferase